MSDTERTRAEVSTIIEDIARIQAEMGHAEHCYQAEDREAFEIVRRIERRLKGMYGDLEQNSREAEGAEDQDAIPF